MDHYITADHPEYKAFKKEQVMKRDKKIQIAHMQRDLAMDGLMSEWDSMLTSASRDHTVGLAQIKQDMLEARNLKRKWSHAMAQEVDVSGT